MNVNELLSWIERVQNRKDLQQLLKDKRLLIAFETKGDKILLAIMHDQLEVIEEHDELPQVVIQANDEILEELWTGKQKLLHVPPHMIHLDGRFRDLLFIESMFHLAS